MKKEIWKNIDGFENYQISNYGNVKSIYDNRKHKILKFKIGKKGYYRVTLYKNKKMNYLLVSRLVAKTFICNINNCPDVNHKDGDKSNNKVNNLEWCTKSYNTKHAYKNNLIKKCLGEDHHMAKLKNEQIKYIRETKNKIKGYILAEKFNISTANISRIRNNRLWIHVR